MLMEDFKFVNLKSHVHHVFMEQIFLMNTTIIVICPFFILLVIEKQCKKCQYTSNESEKEHITIVL